MPDSSKLYSWLLRLYPARFREEYQVPMERQFRDEYRDRLTKFIEAKARGKRPRLPTVKTRATGASVEDQLAKSLAALKRGKEKKVA